MERAVRGLKQQRRTFNRLCGNVTHISAIQLLCSVLNCGEHTVAVDVGKQTGQVAFSLANTPVRLLPGLTMFVRLTTVSAYLLNNVRSALCNQR